MAIEITEERSEELYELIDRYPKCYTVLKKLPGTYKDYDAVLLKIIKLFGVEKATPQNINDIISRDVPKNNYLTYKNLKFAEIYVNKLLNKKKLNEINERYNYVARRIHSASVLLFTRVHDFLNYMEPVSWLDYYVYTKYFYDVRIETAKLVTPELMKDFIGKHMFDQYGNELMVTNVVDNEVHVLRSDLRVTNKLFRDYVVTCDPVIKDGFVNICVEKPNTDRFEFKEDGKLSTGYVCDEYYIIPSKLSLFASSLIDIKVSDIYMLVDKKFLHGEYCGLI